MKQYNEKLLVKAKRYLMLLIIANLSIACVGRVKNGLSADQQLATSDSVVSYKRNYTDTLCSSWTINDEDVLGLLTEFDTLSGYEWHNCYGVFDCSIEGELILEGVKYSYSLNAGGWAKLAKGNSEVFIGSHNPADSLYFFSINFCDKDWD